MIKQENITTTEIPLETATELLKSPIVRDRNDGIGILIKTMTETSLEENTDNYQKGLQLAVNATDDEHYTVQYAAVGLIGNVLKQTQGKSEYSVEFYRAMFALGNVLKYKERHHRKVVVFARDKWDSIWD
jgi:hypothetical protein